MFRRLLEKEITVFGLKIPYLIAFYYISCGTAIIIGFFNYPFAQIASVSIVVFMGFVHCVLMLCAMYTCTRHKPLTKEPRNF